jgi:hypothetical protein
MRSFVSTAIFTSCVLVGAVTFVAAQNQAPAAPPAPGQGGAPGGGRAAAPLENIKVLPKTWTRMQVQALMQTFVESLGQTPPGQGQPPAPQGAGRGCAHCHVQTPAPPGGGRAMMNYVSDENANKDIARKMIQMTMAANADYLKTVGDTAVAEKVSCYSCHRGEATKPALAPAAGWARGGFSLLPAGPPARGGGGAPGAPPKQ